MSGDTFTQIMLGVITIMGAFITAFVVPWIRAKMSNEEIALLQSYITIAVRCANQIFTSDQWKDKKTYVMEYIRGLMADNLNISLTDDQIDTIVEGIVNEVKNENKQ